MPENSEHDPQRIASSAAAFSRGKGKIAPLRRRFVGENHAVHPQSPRRLPQPGHGSERRCDLGARSKAVSVLRARDAADIGKIERHRGTAENKPVIAGTRIPVKSIKAFSDAGY